MVAVSIIFPVTAQEASLIPQRVSGESHNEIAELQTIRFVGCSATSPDQLIGIIQSRESELSLTRSLGLYYYENLVRNPATPQPIMATLRRVQRDLREELLYFSAARASDDSVALLEYLDQNGFHLAKVSWRFFRDTDVRKNVLEFTIQEGPRAAIDTVLVFGLDSVPTDILTQVHGARSVKHGDAFSESDLNKDLQAMTRVLQNNGYYRAGYKRPTQKISEDALHDTLAVVFVPGPRMRIGAIEFEENANGFPSVTESMRRRQLEFETNEWYSRDKVELSRSNLVQLGVFELATIDTLEADLLHSTDTLGADSFLVMRVFTLNSKPYELGANFLLFQTALDNYLNAGVGATYQHRNVFGGAQVGSITAQYILQDLSRIFQGQPLEREALLSGVVAWPSLLRVWDWRAGLQTNAYYSERQLVSPFRLQSVGIGGRLPVNLPQYRGINGFDLNIGFERQVPRDFQGALDSALKDAETPEEIAFVYSTFNQFLVLDNYIKTTGNLITGIYTGFNIRGEHRDNPVDPRRGYFANFSLELGMGAGQFVRGQAFLSNIFPLSERSGLATKVRLGHIQLLDFTRGSTTDTNTYVTLERQFFAGGAASIRSYPSRALHDPNSGVLDATDASTELVLNNTVGSGTLIELSCEYRYQLPKPRGWDPIWSNMVSNSGFAAFMDIGNAFNRMTVEKYGTMQLKDVWQGSVIAVGLGYRFLTPVGPFRVDYATSVYDPLQTTGKWIWSGRSNIMSSDYWELSIGLGHPF